MKKLAYGRGQGKTTRLLYASEFNNAPIVCQTYQSKNYLMEMAERLKLNIPEPIVVSEIASGRVRGTENMYKDLGLRNVHSKVYEGMRHEILNEDNRAIVYQDVVDFFKHEIDKKNKI